MIESSTYPWLATYQQQLWQQHQQQRLPHALMLVNATDIGQHSLAICLAQALLCTNISAQGVSCQQCEACAWFAGQTHPDFIQIAPEAPGKAIKVDAVRELTDLMTQHAHQGGWRVVFITSADAMNDAAVNALLKTLEAPPAKTFFILLAARPNNLPATLVSRCQLLKLNSPKPDVVINWLAQQNFTESDAQLAYFCCLQSPKLAQQLLVSGKLSEQKIWLEKLLQALQPAAPFLDLSRTDFFSMIQLMASLLDALICAHSGASGASDRILSIFDSMLPARLSLVNCYKLYDYLLELQRARTVGVTLSEPLAMDKLALLWQQCAEER